jgi:hypothetical protein
LALQCLLHPLFWGLQVYYIAKKCNQRCTAEEYAITLARHFVDTYPKAGSPEHPAGLETLHRVASCHTGSEDAQHRLALSASNFPLSLHHANRRSKYTGSRYILGQGRCRSAGNCCSSMSWVQIGCAGHKSKGHCGTGALAESDIGRTGTQTWCAAHSVNARRSGSVIQVSW